MPTTSLLIPILFLDLPTALNRTSVPIVQEGPEGNGGRRQRAAGKKEKNEKNDDDAYLQNEGRLLAFFKKCVMCLFFSTSSQIVRVRYANLGDCGVAQQARFAKNVKKPQNFESSSFVFIFFCLNLTLVLCNSSLQIQMCD